MQNGPSSPKPTYEELERMCQMLADQNKALATEIRFRAQPAIGELTDSIHSMAAAAKEGSVPAKQILGKLFEAIDEGREATSKLSVVHGRLPGR